MGDKTKIEWSDATWNPVTGCDRCSPGCDNCYALKLAGRLKKMGAPNYQRDGNPVTSGPGFGVTCHPHMLEQPARWKRPRRVFVNSMSDLFHPAVPDEFIVEVFDVMANCPRHTFQVLTKRPQRMEAFVTRYVSGGFGVPGLPCVGVLPNVWLGVSIESDRYAWRADHLRQTPAAVRWISAEPLLGPIPSLSVWLAGIDWLVVGGESGPGARPMHPDWVRDLRDRCNGTVPFFFKQWGRWAPIAGLDESFGRWVDPLTGDTRALATPGAALMSNFGKRAAGRELDGRIWDEMPTVAHG